MKPNWISVLIIALTFALVTAACAQSVRIKDIATIDGVRPNQLVGYGLVVGLNGSGDSQQSLFTAQSISNLLETYGLTVSSSKLKVKNVAAVIITATLPPFARPGTTIDVVVSSIGDARSLQGGTLLQVPLKAANGDVYAVAQGPVSIGGFSAASGGSSSAKNHPTVGRVPGGAIVEKETKTDIAPQDTMRITLNQNDFTTASRVAEAINARMAGHLASAVDGDVVSVNIPAQYQNNIVDMIAELESVEVTTDAVAKVIVNERTGTVIIGGQARISPVAIAHGALSVEISTNTTVSQPNPVSTGSTVVAPQTTVTAKEEPAHLIAMNSGTTIEELTRALNALRVTPRDLIAILQAIKEAGALQAQLEII